MAQELKARLLGQTMSEYGCDTRIYLKSEADKVIAHNKYKRCLMMAKWCDDRWADIATQYYKSVWYRKWQLRWLELAEKFKEAK